MNLYGSSTHQAQARQCLSHCEKFTINYESPNHRTLSVLLHPSFPTFQPANLASYSFHRDRRSTAIVHVPLLPCHVILYSIMLKGNTRYCLCGASAVILSLSLSLRESALEQHLYNVVQFQQAGCQV